MLKNGSDQNRFGFIISQKVSKKAVVRNKIRRRLAEIAKINLNKSYVGFDFVFIIMPIAGQKSFSEIAECVKNIINKI